jgi:hypothetical protein
MMMMMTMMTMMTTTTMLYVDDENNTARASLCTICWAVQWRGAAQGGKGGSCAEVEGVLGRAACTNGAAHRGARRAEILERGG